MATSLFDEFLGLLQDDPHLLYSINKDVLKLGPSGASDLFSVEPRETGELVLEWGAWHGHYEQPSDCLDTIRRIIAGNIRRMLQYKRDRLAASWIEQMHEDGCSRNYTSIFLNPFDEDAWIGSMETDWEVIAGYAFLGDLPGILVFPDATAHGPGTWEDRPTYRPYMPDEWMLKFLPNTLGQAPKGWTWTSVEGNEIAFLKPKTWEERAPESDDAEVKASKFVAPDESAWIWVQCFWSEPYEQQFEPGSKIAPTSVTKHPIEFYEGIHRSMIDLEFEGPYERMLVRFTCDSSKPTHRLHTTFRKTIHLSRRLVPNS